MSDPIAWQVFSENAEAIAGKGVTKSAINKDSTVIVGAAHVWLWRKNSHGNVEILLQKRAQSKNTWAGYFDISAAGHIDVGETALQAAVREANEEISLLVDASKLNFILTFRTPLDHREIDWVYTYRLNEEVVFTFQDGEVEAVEWCSLESFRQAVADPEFYHLVPQGDMYFTVLINALIEQVERE